MTRPGGSWQAEPGDIDALRDWNGGGVADHTEDRFTGYHGGRAVHHRRATAGPSNVDGFGGQGGVHRHRWNAPAGQGNNQVSGRGRHLQGGHLRRTRPPDQGQAQHRRPSLGCSCSSRRWMTGADVRVVQQALNQRNHAGPGHRRRLRPPRRATPSSTGNDARSIEVDGIIGPQARYLAGPPGLNGASGALWFGLCGLSSPGAASTTSAGSPLISPRPCACSSSRRTARCSCIPTAARRSR